MESFSDFSSYDNYDIQEINNRYAKSCFEFVLTVSDLHKLKAAWRNEQAAPDLLPYEEELINEVNESAQNMEDLIEKHMAIAEDRFRAHLFQIELNR
jgi:GINS complex subunit 4